MSTTTPAIERALARRRQRLIDNLRTGGTPTVRTVDASAMHRYAESVRAAAGPARSVNFTAPEPPITRPFWYCSEERAERLRRPAPTPVVSPDYVPAAIYRYRLAVTS